MCTRINRDRSPPGRSSRPWARGALLYHGRAPPNARERCCRVRGGSWYPEHVPFRFSLSAPFHIRRFGYPRHSTRRRLASLGPPSAATPLTSQTPNRSRRFALDSLWKEMDSNPRSRFTYSPFRTASCRLRDGPVRQNGNHPFATGYRAFEARFRRRVYRATAWGLSAGALPTPPRMGRSPPIGLRRCGARPRRSPTASRNSSKSKYLCMGGTDLINGPRGARRAVSNLNLLTQPVAVNHPLGRRCRLSVPM